MSADANLIGQSQIVLTQIETDTLMPWESSFISV